MYVFKFNDGTYDNSEGFDRLRVKEVARAQLEEKPSSLWRDWEKWGRGKILQVDFIEKEIENDYKTKI